MTTKEDIDRVTDVINRALLKLYQAKRMINNRQFKDVIYDAKLSIYGAYEMLKKNSGG